MPLRSELEENPYQAPLDDERRQAQEKYLERFESEEEFDEALELWPKCPQCGRRRVAHCPICKTAADLFPIGDSEFWSARDGAYEQREVNELSAAFGAAMPSIGAADAQSAPRQCHCNEQTNETPVYDPSVSISVTASELIPGLPDTRQPATQQCRNDVFDDLPDSSMTPQSRLRRRRAWARVNPLLRDESYRAEENDGAPLAVCHVCAEAFSPRFDNSCNNCGYVFGDGDEQEKRELSTVAPEVEDFISRVSVAEDVEDDADNRKLVVTLAVIALIAALAVFYFSYVLR